MQFMADARGVINASVSLAALNDTAAVKQRVAPPSSGMWRQPTGMPVLAVNNFLGWDAAGTSAEALRTWYWLEGEFTGRCAREGLRGEDCTTTMKGAVQKDLEEKMILLLEPYMLHSQDGQAQNVARPAAKPRLVLYGAHS